MHVCCAPWDVKLSERARKPDAAEARLKRLYAYLPSRRLASSRTAATTCSKASSDTCLSVTFTDAAPAVEATAGAGARQCERRCASCCKAMMISISTASGSEPRSATSLTRESVIVGYAKALLQEYLSATRLQLALQCLLYCSK